LSAAASKLGISVSILRRIKGFGSKAFKNGRVYIPVIQQDIVDHPEWLQEPKEDTQEELNRKKTKAEIARIELMTAIKAKRFISIEKIEQDIVVACSQTHAIFKRMENELPQKLQGLTVPEMALIIGQYGDDLCGVWAPEALRAAIQSDDIEQGDE
jgi:hypothetical protein